MIRRFYILALKPFVSDATVHEFLEVLRAADRFIPGLVDSSAGIDVDSRTVLWENTFVDEATYSGPYMVSPFHIGAIDNYVMADSPECITQDIYTVRHQMHDASQQVRGGVRRVLLFNVSTDADAAAIDSRASRAVGMVWSAFGADDVGWVSAKGRAWTHVWEQSFTDDAQLHRYLRSVEGISCSSVEGFARLGIELRSLKVISCPFDLAPIDQQTPAVAPHDDRPVLHTITAHVALDDVERYIELIERLYDPFMLSCGAALVHRWRTIDRGYLHGEIQSTWRLDSLAAYSDIRSKTYADPGWNEFIRDAMPLVRGGHRRFYHER